MCPRKNTYHKQQSSEEEKEKAGGTERPGFSDPVRTVIAGTPEIQEGQTGESHIQFSGAVSSESLRRVRDTCCS